MPTRYAILITAFAMTAAMLVAPYPGLANDNTLRVATYNLPLGLGNPYTTTSISEQYVWRAIFDPLTLVDSLGELRPALALSWEATDEHTWVFELRPNVRFSNGEPFDADAVVNALGFLISPEGAGLSVAHEVASIKSVHALKSLRVEIRTHYPNLILPRNLAGIHIVAPEHWQRLGPEGFGQNPVGTGPFRVEEWRTATVKLRAVTDSWNPPRVDALEFYEILDVPARVQAIQTGAIDLAFNLGPDDIEELERTGGKVHVSRGAGVTGLTFITVKESPLQNKKVRQALNYAVNKEAYIAVLLAGRTRPASQPAPHYGNGYNPELEAYPYDPPRARALLAEAGYPDGFDFVAEIVVSGGVNSGPIYQFVAQELGKIGVRMSIRPLPVSKLIQKAVSGDWDGVAFGMEFDSKPTMDVMRAIGMHSCQRKVPWYCNQDVMPLVERAQREFDTQKRLDLVREIMRVYRDDPSMLYMHETVHFDGLTARTFGYEPVNRLVNFRDIYLAED